MRRFIITITLFTIILSHLPNVFSQDTNQATAKQRKSKPRTKVNVRYDKTKDMTTVWLEDITLWKNPVEFEQVDMSVSFNYPRQTIVTPKSVLITIHSASKGGPLFEYQRDMVVIADGSNLSFGKMEREGNRNRRPAYSSGPFFEMLGLSIPYEDFSRIAKAKKVRVQVGERTYNLSEKQLLSLSNFLELMQQEGQEFK